ncbi:hypothetical protein E2C01_055382 [Portunus trituberculatus]|uniref:Uncharacterized protein n=1 Tax=Portunus trituberculatus TaxID=210409 RepID=A0A5B7GR10_PORTR|nr:hypothetical protein [Portunus trituberculatus]
MVKTGWVTSLSPLLSVFGSHFYMHPRWSHGVPGLLGFSSKGKLSAPVKELLAPAEATANKFAMVLQLAHLAAYAAALTLGSPPTQCQAVRRPPRKTGPSATRAIKSTASKKS